MRIPATIEAIVSAPARVWKRLYGFLEARAERQIAAWLSALQYKRRYTNPDLIKRYRQRP